MLIKVGIENNNENRSIAWALDYPGCFAYGSNETEALIRIPQSLIAFKGWLDGYTDNSWLKDLGDFDVRLVETFESHFLNQDYEPDANGKFAVGAWFHHDWLPLTEKEIEHGLLVITWAHNDLYEMTINLDDTRLDQNIPEERWSIRQILCHVANAEWHYLDCLFLAGCSRGDLPESAYERMQTTLDLLKKSLPSLTHQEIVQGREGEFWSPRKILRQSCWHALDHCQHIHKLINTK